jgi:uncharacterized protein YdhG (YjbR/CyaY superfamily)
MDEYLAGVPAAQRVALEKLRRAVHAAAPGAEEGFSYGLPAFRWNGRPLVAFGAWAEHCALYPLSSAATQAVLEDLADFETSKGTIRFTPQKPLPARLVKKLVQVRLAELAAAKPARPGRSPCSPSRPTR